LKESLTHCRYRNLLGTLLPYKNCTL